MTLMDKIGLAICLASIIAALIITLRKGFTAPLPKNLAKLSKTEMTLFWLCIGGMFVGMSIIRSD